MVKCTLSIVCLSFLLAAAAEALAGPATVGVKETARRGEAVEWHLPADQTFTPWLLDPALFPADQGDGLETRQVLQPVLHTVKLENVVPPIRFEEGEAEIPADYLAALRTVLESMRERTNVRLHFVGHADSLPLSEALQERYGDNVGLSRERAGICAEYCQKALDLPPEAISYEGAGDSQPVADNASEEGRGLNRRVEVQVWYDQVGQQLVDQEVVVPGQANRVQVCRTETVCKLRYREGHAHRAQVRNLIAPLHYDDGMVQVPDAFLQQLRQALADLRGKGNVVVKFLAYTDDTPLVGRQERIYGNPQGLSQAVARRVAVAVQESLGLATAALVSEGRGATRPLAANDTPQGRALNRRVEVEFWHDDPLQELPAEPQLCPAPGGTETVTRVYDSPTGGIAPILFADGAPQLPPGSSERLRQLLDEVKGREGVRLRFVGYTKDERLDRRTAAVYGDDIGLSSARARRAMAAVSQELGLAENQAEFEGRGYVQSDDVVNSGFTESDTSRVRVQVVYDEQVPLEDYEGVEITPLTRPLTPANPFGLNLMRITVDGAPLDDMGKSNPDVQRCTDVALDAARIAFKYDNLKLEPRLNVTAWPLTIAARDREETPLVENRVQFRLYANYRSFITAAEVRIFDQEQSVAARPLAVVPLDDAGLAQWQPPFAAAAAPGRALKYVLRVRDAQGRFDETTAQPLWVVDAIDPAVAASDPGRELLAGYGESRLARRTIPLHGGTVQVRGRAIPAGHTVWLAGYGVPVDDQGRCVAEEILPQGLHTVEVAVLDPAGNGELFLRDLALDTSDWFTVGIADLTLAAHKTDGPAPLLAPEQSPRSDSMDLQGRLAFYSKGKFGAGWNLTASADTREGPLDEIFSNFLDKSPEALLRRLDPQRHYPTFGDDGSVTEAAPTQGKFFLQLEKDQNFGLWGNFRVDYNDNELAPVGRGLYGAHLHYQSLGATSFGEQRLATDGFAAAPGTVAGRDEFRGTGGSLYFLRRQDLLQGSEQVRIEVRDKDSGLVLGVKNLIPGLDYALDYLPGRLLLNQPLAATADDRLLVESDTAGGNPVFLVVRYEFTPGFDQPDTVTTGGQVHYWLNDYLQLGMTAARDQEAGQENALAATEVTLRKSALSWLKLAAGRSRGPAPTATTSGDGGFQFTESSPLAGAVPAAAYRADASIDGQDFFANGRGRLTFYRQDVAAGYAAAGLSSDRDTAQSGGTAQWPFSDRVELRLKADQRRVRQGLATAAGEVNLEVGLQDHWQVSSGLRHDSRQDHSAQVPLTQAEGSRTDGVVRVLYDSHARWEAYGWTQASLATSGNREENSRLGGGGSVRLSDRLKLSGEASGGNLGLAGRLGTDYLYSDRSTLYLNYALENERSDNGLRARKGAMTSGFRTRYGDSASVYLEERYSHGDTPTGLLHATGVQLALSDRLNLGANLEFGTLTDNQSGAELQRTAAGVSAGYGFDRLQLASALEYRVDDAEQPDTATTRRTSWLLKNSLKYQLSPDWRLLGKLDFAHSASSQGAFFDGDYTEAVLGYAYRPVHNDRLNALLKYTYFYNLPAAQQVSGGGTTVGVIQRSHIAALDVTYDLTSRWSVGGKYAYRQGEVSQDRVHPEFFASRAHLYVVRADWHFLHRWDALAEGRLLQLPDAQDRLGGVLLGLYRHLGDHLKLGAGYNFSSFSDDLTDLDYHRQGLFINLIGKL